MASAVLLLLASYAMLVQGQAFGRSEDKVVTLDNAASTDAKRVHDFDQVLDSQTEDELCCDKKKMAFREALFAKFMNAMPPRQEVPNSDKPYPYNSDLKLMCDMTKIPKLHYIDHTHRKTKHPNSKKDAFGDGERKDWGNAYIDENHKVIFTPLIPKTGTTSFSKCFGDNKEYKLEKLEEVTKKRKINWDEYTILTAIRSPLDRFFSSHSQIEAFLFIVSKLLYRWISIAYSNWC